MSNQNKPTRIDYLDMAKGIGILFVVIFHTLGSVMNTDPKPFIPYVMQYVVTIALPVFFISSGMLVYIKRDKLIDFKTFMARKARGLMLPYLSFSIIVLVQMITNNIIGKNVSSVEEIRNAVIAFVTLRGFSVLWFLPALFIAELMFYWCQKLKPIAMHISLAVAAVLILTFSDVFSKPLWDKSVPLYVVGCILMTFGRGVMALVFIWVGYVLMSILEKLNLNKMISLLIGIVLLAINFPLGRKAGGINVNYMIFKHSYLFFIAAIVGSAGAILFCKGLPEFKPLSFCGKQSLIIMATHMDFKVLAYSISAAYHLLKYIPRAKVIALYGMIGIFIVLFELLWIFIFNKFLYKLIGK